MQEIKNGIDRTHLKRLSLKLPPLEEQKRITEILSSIDYKIELNRRINDNLMPTYYA